LLSSSRDFAKTCVVQACGFQHNGVTADRTGIELSFLLLHIFCLLRGIKTSPLAGVVNFEKENTIRRLMISGAFRSQTLL
jgi:hypothetical protein